MQAKIIDFASDKIAKTLNKIDKKDVKKAVTSVKGRWQNRNSSDKKSKSVDNLNNVTCSEEYCDMLRNEFKLDEKNTTAAIKKEEKILQIEGNDGMNLNNLRPNVGNQTPKVHAIEAT